jgi:multidrug resistance efflux pump
MSTTTSGPAPLPITEEAAPPGQAARKIQLGLLALIVLSLLWYFAADRLTPYTSQARVQAFVVPVAAEVSGTVKKVWVKKQ